jgi:DNA-binding GntR family transcriptional regulator
LQVLETRRELDRLIARSAARRSTPAERQRIAELADAMAEHVRAGDVRGFLRLDGDLNAVAARAARNEIAANTVATLHSVSRRFWFYHHQDNHRAAQTMTLHVALARAIASGDDAAAGVASDTLTDQLFEFARSTLIAA